jgi:hypothetical protein
MVEVDARIKAYVFAATSTGLVYDDRTFDFESCVDTGSHLEDQVRCKGEGEGERRGRDGLSGCGC